MTDNAARLRELHRPGDPLLLPNVWDRSSARIVQEAGFPALATASAAVSAMLGYPDQEGAFGGDVRRRRARHPRRDRPGHRGRRSRVRVTARRAGGTAARHRRRHCNLEDTYAGELAEPQAQAEFLAAVRDAMATPW